MLGILGCSLWTNLLVKGWSKDVLLLGPLKIIWNLWGNLLARVSFPCSASKGKMKHYINPIKVNRLPFRARHVFLLLLSNLGKRGGSWSEDWKWVSKPHNLSFITCKGTSLFLGRQSQTRSPARRSYLPLVSCCNCDAKKSYLKRFGQENPSDFHLNTSSAYISSIGGTIIILGVMVLWKYSAYILG